MTDIQQLKDINNSKRIQILEREVESHYLSKIHILAQRYRRMGLVKNIWINIIGTKI